MPPRPLSVAKLANRIVLLFLAFAVFSWGVQAKVSLYSVHSSPSKVAAAKLLTEDRTTQISVSLKVLEEPVGSFQMLRLIASAASHPTHSLPSFRIRRLKTNLHYPSACASRLVSLMRRPPPTLV